MFSDKVFQVSFVLSLAIHSAMFASTSQFSLRPGSTQKKAQSVEVTYIKQEQIPKLQHKAAPKGEPFLKMSSRISADKRIPPPYVDSARILKPEQAFKLSDKVFDKPTFAKADILAIKKKITIPPIEIDKINNPSYISYYQLVREKIKRAAYQNYTGQETGEATVSFLVSRDGKLQELRLIEDKSPASQYLREIALRSVKDGADFPAFPKDLDYYQLSFNLAITFEFE